MGLIPNPLNLAVAGDGTSIRTGGSPYGIKTCDYRKNGTFNCDCSRRFADPQANWGWDSHRKEYLYGYMLYELIAVETPHSLPIYLRFGQAARHDSVLGVVALAETRHIYQNLRIGKFLGDSAHDAYAYYELLKFWPIEPFIDLNNRNKGHFKCTPPFHVTENGVPACPAGCEMVFKGYDKARDRMKWRCPLIAGSKSIKAQVSCDTPCSPSDYGRTVYTKPADDLRIFTPTPRESEEWKIIYNMRSGAERSFSRLKKDYNIEESKIRRVRSLKAWCYRAHLVAMNQHLDAWVEHAKEKGLNIWAEIAGDTAKVA
ncbi:MAG: transposase [Candidatus Methanomethyliaceae archaeon]